jgi:hypothetical protein
MNVQSNNDIYLELVTLRNQSGQDIYKRLCLARTLLHDRDWVEDKHKGGGDESLALDRLEDNCFADICGALSLPEMLEILHHVPDVKRWEKAKFNLKKLHKEWKEKTKPKNGNAPPTLGEPGEIGPPLQPTEQMQRQGVIEGLQATVRELRDRLHTVTEDNKRLRGENTKLRKTLERITKVTQTIEVN